MSNYSEFYDTIDDILNHLRTDLIGPVCDNEIIENEGPLDRYPLGILWPVSRRIIGHAIEISQDTEELFEELREDETLININSTKPSSMALSFCVNSGDVLHISFSYAVYTHNETYENDDKKAVGKNTYIRQPQRFECDFCVPSCVGRTELSKGNDILSIYAHVRRINESGSLLVTVSASNTQEASNTHTGIHTLPLFQCELCIDSKSGFQPVFNPGSQPCDTAEEMQYDSVDNYCCGHGCSVEFICTNGIVSEIRSSFIPVYRVKQMMPRVLMNSKCLHMEYWKDISREVGCDALTAFVAQYESWLHEQQEKTNLINKYPNAAKSAFSDIERCISRLKNGIHILMHNNCAWTSFRYMNEAMLWQRIKTKHCDPKDVSWYPFQMAYILQIIPDIVDKSSKYYGYVDLLYFPTGGGKTEAYLGLSAFVIFFRRLNGCEETIDGVTIIMRYTLRLLTIQQFERAMALICACEYMRNKYHIPGGEISAGLWIGAGMTPNYISDAGNALDKRRADANVQLFEADPMQIEKCPWCGAPINIDGYSITNDHMNICCPNAACEFHAHLPIYVVDDDIYQAKPTLLLSTVDKFARITWEERAGSLFGADGNLPPELVIQDELHLISGPLGSITGIYEIAVDEICRHYGGVPKFIASTATVRNADQQIRILYNRNMLQFPPNSLSREDSFFAVEADESQKPARTYVGLCSLGGTSSEIIIRIFALLVYLKHLYIKQGKPFDVIDQFYTTVGYFNTLKELGTASNIITDRVLSEIRYLVHHKFKYEAEKWNVTVDGVNSEIPSYLRDNELTSRNNSREIKKVLARLDAKFSDASCFDYIMASNMLSVGIDIDRLGIMCVYGQPKSNAEYIQATSRVGRKNPGLVMTIYNGVRSRDKSHFEQFMYYHAIFYKYVEASSVTSYSPRAIEKALHCAFISIVRHTVEKYRLNFSAGHYVLGDADVESVKDTMLRRVYEIDPRVAAYAREWLDYFTECWYELTKKTCGRLVFCDYHNDSISLLRSGEKCVSDDIPSTLNSVRNVEPSADIYFTRR